MRYVIAVILFTLAPATAYADEILRVASFNINWGNVDLADIARAIGDSDADVVCLQESTPESEGFLSRQFAQKYPHMSFDGDARKFAAGRFGFLSRHRLSDSRFIPAEHGLFGTYIVNVNQGAQKIQVVNVHLSPFRVPRDASVPQVLGWLTAVEAEHAKEIEVIAGVIDPGAPTVVCGDFNSISTLSAPSRLRELGLTDSFSAVTENADAHPTWRWPVGRTHIQFRIDYVFCTDHFESLSSRIVPTTGSDHSLLVTELRHAGVQDN
ncbi:MAG: endonuclease/exonuclease/phosphatase family protein [Planctomycetaceae bacterium]